MKILGLILALLVIASCGQLAPATSGNLAAADANISSGEKIKSAIVRAQSAASIEQKINVASKAFLNTAYMDKPLGEGDQNGPLYRDDGFDCTTLIETTMAVATSKNFDEFLLHLNQIRYKNAQVSLLTRNHFPDADWSVNNSTNGRVADITATLASTTQLQLLNSTANIDRKTWFQAVWKLETNFAPQSFSIPYFDVKSFFIPEQLDGVLADYVKLENEMLAKIKAAGSNTEASLAARDEWRRMLSAIDLSCVVRSEILAKIPAGLIMNLATPGWVLKNADGSVMTGMNIGHQALIVKDDQNHLMVREASKNWRKVQDTPLAQYLLMKLTNSTQKGVNFLKINP